MLKHLMNGSSLLALALRDTENENGADPKAALREKLAKGNIPEGENNGEQNADSGSNNEGDGEGEENEGEENEEDDEEENEEDVKDPPEDETAEQKKEREDKEKLEAKTNRKQERMQRRIDKAVAAQKAAETELERLKAQLEANPDQKLTAEEIERQAQALADKKAKEKELADLDAKFKKECDALQKAANKADKDFDTKIHDIAEDIGPIPSFMIGILNEMDNGGEVLAHIANDDELAEEIWEMRPTKMTKKLVEISAKLEEAKKPPRRQISKVPDIAPVRPNRVVSNTITEADAKNMDVWVRKRQAQMAEARKAKGFN